MSLAEQFVAEVGTEEAGAAGDEGAHNWRGYLGKPRPPSQQILRGRIAASAGQDMFVALRAVPGPAAEPGLASRLTTAFILAHRTGRDTLLRVPLLPPVRRVDPTFPGLGPAVLIVLAILGLQIACIVPVAIWAAFREGVTGIPALVMNPWVLGAANLVAIGSVVLYSLRHTGETPRQFFALRPIGVREEPIDGQRLPGDPA